MDQNTQSLICELEACASLLRDCSEDHWASWLEKSVNLIKQRKFSGIELFEGAFGGMGSINDLVLSPINGHTIEQSKVGSCNDQMRNHFEKAHKLIKTIRKNVVLR